MTKVNKVTLAVILAGTLTAGCGSTPPPDPCQINPTKTNAAGEWVEADGEPLDDDPCDSDDAFEFEDSHKKPTVKKPTNKKPTTRTGGR